MGNDFDCLKSPHTATESRPRPEAVGEALNQPSAQQSVASIAAHLAAGAHHAPVRPAPGGAADHFTIGQMWRTTPVWICFDRGKKKIRALTRLIKELKTKQLLKTLNDPFATKKKQYTT